MIDPISLTLAISAVVIAILSHVKTSKCTMQGIEIETKDSIEAKVERDPLLKRPRSDSI